MLIFETDDSSYEPETNLIAIEKKNLSQLELTCKPRNHEHMISVTQ
jgi:hypothetical protein